MAERVPRSGNCPKWLAKRYQDFQSDPDAMACAMSKSSFSEFKSYFELIDRIAVKAGVEREFAFANLLEGAARPVARLPETSPVKHEVLRTIANRIKTERFTAKKTTELIDALVTQWGADYLKTDLAEHINDPELVEVTSTVRNKIAAYKELLDILENKYDLHKTDIAERLELSQAQPIIRAMKDPELRDDVLDHVAWALASGSIFYAYISQNTAKDLVNEVKGRRRALQQSKYREVDYVDQDGGHCNIVYTDGKTEGHGIKMERTAKSEKHDLEVERAVDTVMIAAIPLIRAEVFDSIRSPFARDRCYDSAKELIKTL